MGTATFFSAEDAMQASLDYFSGDELAASVFVNKYALRDNEGRILEATPHDMHRRLAKEFARIEAKYPNPMSEEEIFALLDHFSRVIPQGSPMSAIGNFYKLQSASNCFVIDDPRDSYAGILYTDQQQAQIMKRRGGVGTDISRIRPKGLATQNAAGTTDGIGIFMERFSNTCREVAQNGRRGALMLSISCHHPEIRTFINIKRDLSKVTGANISIRWSNEFLNAVENNEKVELRFPVDPRAVRQVSEWVNAKEIWDEFVDSAHASGEPGCLYWDTAIENTPSDIYTEEGFGSTSTNPCLTGDTLVAVADGRGHVSIKQLAEEGNDVPVWTRNANGSIGIKLMRNPRVTGIDQDIYLITFDDGSTIKATANHRFLTSEGNPIRVDKMVKGTSLSIATRYLDGICSAKSYNKAEKMYWHWSTTGVQTAAIEHREVWKYYHDSTIPKDHTIHHIDFNSHNNSPDNLQCMDSAAHYRLHADRMKGDKNPIFTIKANPERFAEYRAKMSISTSGHKNGNCYSELSNEQIREHALLLTAKLNKRFSNEEWTAYASENNLPQLFTNYRSAELGSVKELSLWAAHQSGIAYREYDQRLAATMIAAEDQGYKPWIECSSDGRNNLVMISRNCEECNASFSVEYHRRERAFCNSTCSNNYLNKHTDTNIRRSQSINDTYNEKARNIKQQQLLVYTSLKQELGRIPMLKEWEGKCKDSGVPFRLKTKHGFASWKEIRAQGERFNHRVESVTYIGKDTVYNGTVDATHNFYIGGFKSNNQFTYINTFNCGEIILSPRDSCRLITMNSMTYVKDAFTPNATFDFVEFKSDVEKAQRLMDDMIDLEIELVDRILDKIHSDPEPDYIKEIERDLWTGIRVAAVNGRRTGLGITAIGDTIAALGICYGSKDSIQMVEEIYKTLALGAYRSSVNMARERGTFPIFNLKKEEGHQFLQRIWDADPELYQLYVQYGRRNIALTTTAPVGSVSTLTQTTSGIEPVFMTHYKRRKKINPNDKAARVDFVDQLGDKWQEYIVYHHGVSKWMQATGETDIAKGPYNGATANEINWEAGVDLQAAAQKWVCHAISKTTNLPNSATKEDIDRVYRRGWKSGCKGITVYRDGCRSGVLVAVEPTISATYDSRPDNILPTHAPRRPESLPCEIHHVTIKGMKWVILVGLMGGKPYEIFAGAAENLILPAKLKSGFIKKVKNGTYSLHVPDGDDELIVKNIVNTFDNPESAWASRMISMSLRHGVAIEFVVEQLNKDGNITDINKVLSRVLKKFIGDGSAAGAKCNNCGSKNVAYAEGCLTCHECGSSKC
jgi:ribonucleotide reductase alpha subunit